jgi:adenylosuccinate lyase
MRVAIDDHARLQRIPDVESALAHVGVIPKNATGMPRRTIRLRRHRRCRAGRGQCAHSAGEGIDCRGRQRQPDAARYVYWTATTQDIIDTALALDSRT